MSAHDVTTSLGFRVGEVPALSEAEFVEYMQTEGVARPLIDEQSGTLTITSGDVTMMVSDLLHILMAKFCFSAIESVLKTGEGTYIGWESEDILTLRRLGDEVEIQGDYQDAVRFPLHGLAVALHVAASRYIDLIARFWAEDEMAHLDAWRNMAARTKELIAAKE